MSKKTPVIAQVSDHEQSDEILMYEIDVRHPS